MTQYKNIEPISVSIEGDNQARIVGKGRSGVVYLERDQSNGDMTTV